MPNAATDAPAALAAVLDTLIPPSADGRLPGAGELGLAEGLWGNSELRAVLEGGIAAADAAARERGAEGFAGLAREDRRAALEATAGDAPAFLPTALAQTLVAYYQHPRVIEALGLDPRPPFPRGYRVEETDFTRLQPAKGRAPFYRQP